jgi:hypothetical protein
MSTEPEAKGRHDVHEHDQKTPRAKDGEFESGKTTRYRITAVDTTGKREPRSHHSSREDAKSAKAGYKPDQLAMIEMSHQPAEDPNPTWLPDTAD